MPIPLSRELVAFTPALDRAEPALESGQFAVASDERSRPSATSANFGSSLSDPNVPQPWQNFPSDKYEIGKQIGVGGMGIVYAGVHRLTGQAVALKTLRTHLHSTEEAIERFVREAQVLARVSGPGVVQLYDCAMGVYGVPYLVMEKLNGVDLRTWLDRRSSKALSREAVLRVALDVTNALLGVHAKNVVHRDIKPENVFLSQDHKRRTRACLIDFGVAKVPTNNSRLTLVEHAVGSLLYISPEQLNDSRDVSPASDVWSIGMLMLELLLGAHPYPSELSDAQLICRILSDEPPRLRELVPSPDQPLDDVIERCLMKDPSARYPDARALSEALLDCVG